MKTLINKKSFNDGLNENVYTIELYKNSSTGDLEYRTAKGVKVKVAGPAGIAALEASVANFVDGSSSFDTISELTAATGVTVDGVLLKDGGIVLADGAAIDADIINEATAATGVTIDGVLLKDGGAVFADGASIEVDTVNEATAAAGVTVDGVLLKDGLVNRATTVVTTTGVSQTLAAGYNDVIFISTTTGTDLAKISNSGINVGHQVSLIYVAETAGADELVLSKLNAGDGIGFTTITFSTVGNTATLCWGGNAWFIVSVSGAVVA